MRRVYFIRPIGMESPIKIGCSVSPDGRRRTLESWCPLPLEIIAEIDGDFQLERRFHARFLDSYIRHEWFHASPELNAAIEQIVAGTFDLTTLPKATCLKQRSVPRDRSWVTPGWRYLRSVESRMMHMRRRGLPWTETAKIDRRGWREKVGAELAAIKALVEPIMAEWEGRFPSASRRTPKLRKAA